MKNKNNSKDFLAGRSPAQIPADEGGRECGECGDVIAHGSLAQATAAGQREIAAALANEENQRAAQLALCHAAGKALAEFWDNRADTVNGLQAQEHLQ